MNSSAVDPRNTASRRLLVAVGFAETPTWDRPLGSYDDGDIVFVRH